jgi:hypothetical protein
MFFLISIFNLCSSFRVRNRISQLYKILIFSCLESRSGNSIYEPNKCQESIFSFFFFHCESHFYVLLFSWTRFLIIYIGLHM